jgi:hypothetical protein
VVRVDDQVSVALAPSDNTSGSAVRVSVGIGGGVTATVTLCDAVPPAPVQASMYVALSDSAAVSSVPLVALSPLQPPLAVQEVALLDDHVSVEFPPSVTEVGLAVKASVGTGGAVTRRVTFFDIEPPLPEQIKV